MDHSTSLISEVEQGIQQLAQLVDLASSSDPEVLTDPATSTELYTQFQAGKASITMTIQHILSSESPPDEEVVEHWDNQVLSLDLEFYRALHQL